MLEHGDVKSLPPRFSTPQCPDEAEGGGGAAQQGDVEGAAAEVVDGDDLADRSVVARGVLRGGGFPAR